jgi:hypothetical protein
MNELIEFLDKIDSQYELRITKSTTGWKLYIRFYNGLYAKNTFVMKKPLKSFEHCLLEYKKLINEF